MKLRAKNLRCSVAIASLGFAGAAAAIDSISIASSVASPDCIEYKVVGICYWLKCGAHGCHVRTSAKVRHYVPETVVSSYANTGANPWTEVSAFSPANTTAQSGYNGTTNYKRENEMTVFKNVDVIGHPGTVLSKFAAATGYICKSATTPYMPYFLSTFDTVAWRYGTPEMAYPQALIPGMREVGSMTALNLWGNVYPREGFLHQVDDYKAAAVMAQRAGDVVTRSGQIHVYQPIIAKASDGYWPPGPITEGDIKTHKWQELVPKLSQSCAVFPNDNPRSQAEDGAYAWALWRPYSCCKRAGQKFLFSTDFDS
ncbi:integrating conjugative element protein [Pseudomonas luteola]|uniref:Integrating conjugative element protein n=1 Tax=Pseudomonas luteola TaxID=47886 RepID=A0A2X2E3D4_PSELU|nr:MULTISPECIES: TIGR03756 family integrating conjugative element protein [Pseudomonas]SPZ02579.1 integrating conjugative element protein [Pseudomonas luteola]